MLEYLEQMWRLAADGQAEGVLFFAALYTSILCSYSALRQFLSRRWPHTTGRLHESSLRLFHAHTHTSTSDREFVVNVAYDYQVDGRDYRGHRLSPWVLVASTNAVGLLRRQLSRIEKDDDGRVRVYYNPRNPAKSYLVPPGRMGMFVTAALAVLPLLWFFLGRGA